MKNTLRALAAVIACYSFKGHDFCCESNRRHVKRVTNRAQRRLNRAIARDAVDEIADDLFTDYLEMVAAEYRESREAEAAAWDIEYFHSTYDAMCDEDPEYADDWYDRHADMYLGDEAA